MHANPALFKIVPSRTGGGDQKFFYPYGETMLRSRYLPVRAVAASVKLTKDIIYIIFRPVQAYYVVKLFEP
ncbi:hypothetical protein Y032_0653g1166 [Ancylostoma ceylanicum]|nr:hypothetical protein Y032_0653g1166 [Ancylostoma ceylanicum]